MNVDLHIHTTASDGSLTPKEVVTKAKKLGLNSIAITDHDTVTGLQEGIKTAKQEEIELVPGIEFNTDYQETEIHILGYYIDHKNQEFLNQLNAIKESRENRVKKMINKLKNLGLELKWDEIVELAGNSVVGRSEVAKLLLKKGYVKNWNEAFNQYISHEAPAYVKRTALTPKQAINLIKGANGIPIIAHPTLINKDDLLPKLINWGAEGLEVYHPEQDKSDRSKYLDFAKQHDLLITGGSDCHGPQPQHDMSLGKIKVPDCILKDLKNFKYDQLNNKQTINAI